jgi:predicted alpha/beta hydrolase family esterase
MKGFAPVPQEHFACPGIVVGSTDDPYGGLEFAPRCAHGWGSRFVSIGPAGHINAASGLPDVE